MLLPLLVCCARVSRLHSAACHGLRGGLPFAISLFAVTAAAGGAGRARVLALWGLQRETLVARLRMEQRCACAVALQSGTGF